MDPARERKNTLATLEASVFRLSDVLNARLIPPEGMGFGFAIRGARDSIGVAVVEGGLVARGDSVAPAGPCRYGIDDMVTRAILTVMKFDPGMRSAAVLQYSDAALSILENDLFLECASFAQARDRGVSTLDWGIAFCCREGVPDVIYEKRPDTGASRLILSGEDPADVANNIIICSNRI